MKIGPTNRSDTVYSISRKQTLGRKKVEKTEPRDRRTDSFEPSAGIQELHEIKKRLREIPEVREEIVARLRREIAAGTYRPDPRKIARGIVEELLRDRQS